MAIGLRSAAFKAHRPGTVSPVIARGTINPWPVPRPLAVALIPIPTSHIGTWPDCLVFALIQEIRGSFGFGELPIAD